MKPKVTIKKKPTKALKKIEALNASLSKGSSVLVGLPKNSNPYPDGTSVIMVGAVHEFGAPEKNIPERSFLRSTVTGKRLKYKLLLTKLAAKVVAKKLSLKDALNILGITVQSDVQNMIVDIKEPPLKYRDGNPLNYSGHLKQSITYRIKD